MLLKKRLPIRLLITNLTVVYSLFIVIFLLFFRQIILPLGQPAILATFQVNGYRYRAREPEKGEKTEIPL